MDTGDAHARARGVSKSYRIYTYKINRPTETFTNKRVS